LVYFGILARRLRLGQPNRIDVVIPAELEQEFGWYVSPQTPVSHGTGMELETPRKLEIIFQALDLFYQFDHFFNGSHISYAP
jgi:hypothetical protein